MQHLDFTPRPVAHAPSPFGFGFGLGSGPSTMPSPGAWQSPTPGHTNVAAFQQLASSINHSLRPMKRGRDSEEDYETGPASRDESMDRSPTPERPKRAPPKRLRMVASTAAGQHQSGHETDKKDNSSGQEIDVGVLLATLPPQSLLPLLTSLVKAKPELKPTILALIPKPTLETALQALSQSAKKLRDAYPYSNTPAFGSTPSFGFGSQQLASNSTSDTHHQGGMRDSYIVSRLRPHITDFVACCMSYLPYFSSTTSGSSSSSLTQAIQTMHKDNSHPIETFLFLHAITNHLVSQPALTISNMAPLLVPRLTEEWESWVNTIDEVVNQQARMFGSETVRNWEKALDDLAATKSVEVSTPMRQIRDRWIAKVGWLVGRNSRNTMDQL